MRLPKLSPYLYRLSSGGNLNGKHCSSLMTAIAISSSFFMAMAAPSWAARETSRDYRACAARLLQLGISAENAAGACATALRPRDLGECVHRIQRQTQVAAQDFFGSCLQARRPLDFSACVVGISKQGKDSFDPNILTYCNRSLLPLRFAKCVVGLRSEIDLGVIRAMDTCIDASDRLGGALAPGTFQFQPVFETTPIPPEQPR